jgi:NADH-quinone oxidoreductase subunit A
LVVSGLSQDPFMSPAVASSVGVVAYLALFAGVGLVFLFANLLIGRFLRPADPVPEKLEIYECGEPTIGSSFVQFDLRFYVVALLFIIFDVEVAFFFPWATVFGKSTHLADPNLVVATAGAEGLVLTGSAEKLYRELGVRDPKVVLDVPPSLEHRVPARLAEAQRAKEIAQFGAQQLAIVTIVDILVFFAVLMVGFAYVWRRGDLDWVRAMTRERSGTEGPPDPGQRAIEEPVLSA